MWAEREGFEGTKIRRRKRWTCCFLIRHGNFYEACFCFFLSVSKCPRPQKTLLRLTVSLLWKYNFLSRIWTTARPLQLSFRQPPKLQFILKSFWRLAAWWNVEFIPCAPADHMPYKAALFWIIYYFIVFKLISRYCECLAWQRNNKIMFVQKNYSVNSRFFARVAPSILS